MVLHVRDCIVGLLISLCAGVVGGSQKSPMPPVPKAGVCLSEAATLVGPQPVQISKLGSGTAAGAGEAGDPETGRPTEVAGALSLLD